MKKNLNPLYDTTWVRLFRCWSRRAELEKIHSVLCLCRFEFNVSLMELQRRILDVAVKNGGGLLSKHKGLLGKVQTSEYFFVLICFAVIETDFLLNEASEMKGNVAGYELVSVLPASTVCSMVFIWSALFLLDDKGLLLLSHQVVVDLTHEEISKGWTQWSVITINL